MHNSNYVGERARDTIKNKTQKESHGGRGKDARFVINRSVAESDEVRDREEQAGGDPGGHRRGFEGTNGGKNDASHPTED